jgi:AAA15 family ATPase/GTPase
MLKSLRIQDFRGIKSADIKRLKRLNIVTGRNGGGKTSVLEAVFLNTGGANANLVISIAGFRGDRIIVPESDRIFRSCFYDLEESRYIHIYAEETKALKTRTRSLRIEALTKPKQSGTRAEHDIFISGVRCRFSGHSGEVVSEADIDFQPFNPVQPATPFTPIQNPVKITVPPQKDIITCHFLSPYYRDVEKQVHDQLVAAKKEKSLPNIVEMLSIVQSGVKDLAPITELGQPNVYVDVGLKSLLPVTALGAGFFHLLRVGLAINEVQDGVIVIDELEDGLHYSILPRLAELLFRALENKSRQIFIATHSRELIDTFIASAKEKNFDDVCVINMTGSTDGVSTRYFDFDEMQYALDLDAELR